MIVRRGKKTKKERKFIQPAEILDSFCPILRVLNSEAHSSDNQENLEKQFKKVTPFKYT